MRLSEEVFFSCVNCQVVKFIVINRLIYLLTNVSLHTFFEVRQIICRPTISFEGKFTTITDRLKNFLYKI